MAINIPNQRQLPGFQSRQRPDQTDQILAVLGQNPIAQGITSASTALSDVLKRRAELKRQAMQTKALEGAYSLPEGALNGLDSSTALAVGKQLHGANNPHSIRNPFSFQAELVDRVRKGEMTLDEAMEEYSKVAPKTVTDPFGTVNRLTPSGPKPVFNQEDNSGTGPEDAVVRLRQTSPKLADGFDKILNDAYPQNNPMLKTSIEGASAASQVKAILKSPNPSQVGLQSLGFYFARMSGSNSQLSDAEREVFEQPLSLIDRVANKGYRLAAGDLSPKMKVDLLRLADTIAGKSTKQAEKIISAQKRRAKSALGRFYNSGLDAAFPTLNDLAVSEDDMLNPGGESAGESLRSKYGY